MADISDLKLFYAAKRTVTKNGKEINYTSVSLASMIVLEEVAAEYEAIAINFASNEQRSETYLSMNPKGRVPTLATNKGILTETPAILLFVAQSYPQFGLAPIADIFELAKLQSFNSYLCSTVHVNHAHFARSSRWTDSESAIAECVKKVPSNMTESFNLIESEYFKGPWVMGDAYTIADAYLYTVSGWLSAYDVALEQFPKIYDHYQRMNARPAVIATWAKHQ